MEDARIGLLGLAVMGQNLARNIANRGYRVAVFNRTASVTEAFAQQEADNPNILPCVTDIADFVAALERPRKILLMVKAGDPVDAVIGQLAPHLAPGDLIMDGGNSFFRDTIRRQRDLAKTQIHFLGVGVSGGEEGALKGPSIMAGGGSQGWDLVSDVLTAIAARANSEPCAAYLGDGGAGHFVKMVHNGIEYADMQLIAESYQLLRANGLTPPGISSVFETWNHGRLDSYLIEITADVLKQRDFGEPGWLVDSVLDSASQKGTGMWAVQTALELGVPVPTVYAGVLARVVSSRGETRSLLAPAESLRSTAAGNAVPHEMLEQALYAAKIAAYAQGIDLIRAGSREFGFGDIGIGTVAKIWRGGCIIRAGFLTTIYDAYRREPELQNLVKSPAFARDAATGLTALAQVTQSARSAGVATPAFDASYGYLLNLAATDMPGASLIQLQRDYFGAHTYKRKDRSGVFHTHWMDSPRWEEQVDR